MAAVIREALAQHLAPGTAETLTADSFTFIGSGRSKPGGPRPCPSATTRRSPKTSRLDLQTEGFDVFR